MAPQALAIQFIQRPSHRLRQAETVLHCPERYRSLGSLPSPAPGVEKSLRIKHRSAMGRLKTLLARSVLPINFQRVKDLSPEADLLYCWGGFPLSHQGKPFVIELDNPYVLSYYNVSRFRLLKSLIRKKLLDERCRQIICISEACRTNLLAELGEDLAEKTSVVYPYIGIPQEPIATREQVARPTFLFVANDFFLKGGREVLFVFEKINRYGTRARLRMVTELPEMFQKYQEFDWIEIVPPGLEKDDLFKEYFLRADVFIHPTFQDSFGMVALEAVAHGLPVIATDLYALREIVGNSDLLLEPPVRFFDRQHCAVAANWSARFEAKIQESTYPAFEQQLLLIVEQCLDGALRRQYQIESQERFDSQFHPVRRTRAFIEAIERATHG